MCYLILGNEYMSKAKKSQISMFIIIGIIIIIIYIVLYLQ